MAGAIVAEEQALAAEPAVGALAGTVDLEARTWLTLKQVAQLLQVDYKAVRSWVNRRERPLPMHLPPGNCKQGRIHRGELDQWVLESWELAS